MPYTQTDLAQPTFLEALTYHAIDDRRILADIIGEGVIGANDFLVTAGGGMVVNIAGGAATIQGGNVADEGIYRVYQATSKTLTIGTADPTNPRIDQIVLRIRNSVHDASGLQKADLVVVPGVATSGANLSNRTGAPNVDLGVEGSNANRLLADVLVPAGATSVSSFNDQRVRASVGGGNALPGASVNIAATVGGLAPYLNGKAGRVKVSLTAALGASVSAIEYIDLVYDSAYGKWVSQPFLVWSSLSLGTTALIYFPVPAGTAYTSPGEDKRTHIWVPLREPLAAGLAPQVRWDAGISTDVNDGTIYGSVFYRYANQGTSPGSFTQAANSEWVSATPPSGAGSDAIRGTGWAAVSVAANDFIQYTLEVKKVGGSGSAYLTGGSIWMRWVA